jgi:hypothetical protein
VNESLAKCFFPSPIGTNFLVRSIFPFISVFVITSGDVVRTFHFRQGWSAAEPGDRSVGRGSRRSSQSQHPISPLCYECRCSGLTGVDAHVIAFLLKLMLWLCRPRLYYGIFGSNGMAGWEGGQTRTDIWRGTIDLHAKEAIAKQKRQRWRGHPLDMNLYLPCCSAVVAPVLGVRKRGQGFV